MVAEGLEVAYRQHAAELIRFATALVGPDDAADVVTDAMIKVFDHSSEERTIDDVRSYLFRAVHRRAIDHGRSRDRRRRREERYGSSDAAAATGEPTTGVDARAALDALSEQQRSVVFLTYWVDLTPAQIADELGVSEGTVRKQLARARARLREILR